MIMIINKEIQMHKLYIGLHIYMIHLSITVTHIRFDIQLMTLFYICVIISLSINAIIVTETVDSDCFKIASRSLTCDHRYIHLCN